MLRLIALLLIVLGLSSCSLGIQNARFSPISSDLNDQDSGVVLGSIESPAAVRFLNLQTNEEIQYLGASIFCLRLPVGKYALKRIGTPYGAVISQNPFLFDVVAGQRNYIGTVVNMWQSDAKRYAENRKQKYEVRYYDMAILIGKGYGYSLFDRFSSIDQMQLKDCPGLQKSDFSVVLMK